MTRGCPAPACTDTSVTSVRTDASDPDAGSRHRRARVACPGGSGPPGRSRVSRRAVTRGQTQEVGVRDPVVVDGGVVLAVVPEGGTGDVLAAAGADQAVVLVALRHGVVRRGIGA